MENEPFADFEMTFYTGVKIHNSAARKELTMKIPVGSSSKPDTFETIRIDMTRPDLVGLTSSQAVLFKHVQDCIRQCIDVEKSSRLDPTTKYPIILKSSRCQNESPGRHRSSSPSPSIHPSAISSYSVSRMSHTGRSTQGSSRRSIGNFNLEINLINLGARSDVSSGRAPTATGAEVRKSAIQSNASVTSLQTAEHTLHFLENVGWLIKFSERRFLMLFMDGTSVRIDAKEQTLEYKDSTMKEPDRYVFL